MQNIAIVKDDDKYLSCQGIEYAISETNVMLQNVAARCERPHIFTSYAPCTPWVKLDAARNQHTLNDRLMYLKQLYTKKSCSDLIAQNSLASQIQENEIACCGKTKITKGYLPTN